MKTARSGLPALPGGAAEQHRHLADGIKQIQSVIAAGEAWDHVCPMLDQLLADLGRHFAHEQELMQRGGYPGLAGHQHEHEAFLARVRAMRARCEDQHSELVSVLAETLHGWFLKHEASSDRRAAEFLKLDEW